MLDEISPGQFHEWMAFWRIEPFGPTEDRRLLAQLCVLMANAWRNPKKSRTARMEDFMPVDPLVRAARKQSPAEQMDQMMKLFKAKEARGEARRRKRKLEG